MLRKILKITGIVLVAIILLLVGFYAKVYFSVENRRNKVYAFTAEEIPINADSATLAHGQRMIVAKGCNDCHGVDLGGKVFIHDPALGLLVASNLTKGEGGLSADYDNRDWILALKHGVRRDGKPLLFMPSHEYANLSEKDMAAVIAYCSQLEPIDRKLPENSLGPLGRILTDLDKLAMFPVEMIDHEKPLVKDVKEEVSPAFGKYLSIACQGCHKPTMKGGEAVAPGFPVVADITSTGNVGKWTAEEFIQTLRTGVTPEGKTLKPEEMPWTMTKAYTDTELKALHLYLTSL